jgi:hypothetical protein
MISEFCLLIWIDIISVLLVFVGFGYIILSIKSDKKTTNPYLMCAVVSFIVGVVAWINISIIFNL